MGVERAMKTPNGTAWVLFKDETSLQKTTIRFARAPPAGEFEARAGDE